MKFFVCFALFSATHLGGNFLFSFFFDESATEGQIANGRTDGRMDGRTEERKDKWTEGQTKE